METATKTLDAPSGDYAGEAHGLCLVVADRGNVWVGQVTAGDQWTIVEGARVVRRWGTTKGLNQLAQQGPQSGTILDTAATVKVATKAIIALVPCEAGAWTA